MDGMGDNEQLLTAVKCLTCRWCWLCERGVFRCLNADSALYGQALDTNDLCRCWEVDDG